MAKLKLYRVGHTVGVGTENRKNVEVLVIAPKKTEASKMVKDEYGDGITTTKRVKMKKPKTFVISGPILKTAVDGLQN